MLRFLLLPFVPAALLAQGPSPRHVPEAPVPPAAILASAPFHGVWIDHDAARDGRVWCRGDRYKMSFGADGAQYLPLFSSHTPGHRQDGWNVEHYGAFHDWPTWRALVTAAGFDELDHFYRPSGLPIEQQPWLASVWRKR